MLLLAYPLLLWPAEQLTDISTDSEAIQLQQINVSTVRPRCSLSVLKQYIVKREFFPSGGSWVKDGEDIFYSPTMCQFKHDISLEDINKCFLSRNLKKILILGDSNGRHYFEAFVKLLSSRGSKNFMYSCKKKKEETAGTWMPDVTYFLKDRDIKTTDVRYHRRDCRSCKSVLSKCVSQDGLSEVVVEYIVMEYLIDTEVSTLRSHEPCTFHLTNCSQSNTYQEFIFGEYLKGNYPDFTFVFGNSHDIRRKQHHQLKADMQYLLSIIQHSMPISSKILWLPVHGHYSRTANYTHWDVLHRANQAWFDALKPFIAKNDTNMYGFLDLQSMSREVLPLWKDGSDLPAHLVKKWYSIIVLYIVQTLCN